MRGNEPTSAYLFPNEPSSQRRKLGLPKKRPQHTAPGLHLEEKWRRLLSIKPFHVSVCFSPIEVPSANYNLFEVRVGRCYLQ